METGFIIFGLIFLINPEIMMLDILPDLIGYIFILRGMKKLARIDDDFFDCKRYLKALIVISAAKLLFMPAVFITNIQTNKLTVQFLFAIAEIFCGFMLSKSFVSGLDMASSRKFGNVLLSGWKEIKIICEAFFPAKVILLMLPQFTVLFYPEIDAAPNEVLDYLAISESYKFTRNTLIIISSALILFLGIYAIKALNEYRLSAKKDPDFSDGMKKLYSEKYLERNDIIEAENIKSAFSFAAAAVFFMGSIYLDNICILPRFLFFVFALVSLIKLSAGKAEKNRILMIFIIFSAISFIIFGIKTYFALVYKEGFQENFVSGAFGISMSAIDEMITVFGAVILFSKLKGKASEIGTAGGIYYLNMALSAVYCILSFNNYITATDNFILIASMWLSFVLVFAITKLSLDGAYNLIKKKTEI